MERVIPSWEDIENFKTPLTSGEKYLIRFLDKYLPKDEYFKNGDSLSNYNGWLIFVQPFLNGSRPDVIIFHPKVGVQIFEVKDWNLDCYEYEQGKMYVNTNEGSVLIKSPLKQTEYYKGKIISQLVPIIGEKNDENKGSYGVIKTALFFSFSTKDKVEEMFKTDFRNGLENRGVRIISRDMIHKDNLKEIVPDYNRKSSNYWKKDWNDELLFWLKPPLHSIEQGTILNLKGNQLKVAEPKKGHFRVRGVAGSGKTNVLAYRAANLASQGYRVLILTFNITLWHVIRDMINRTPFDFSWQSLVFTHFHGFCKDILNTYGCRWPSGENNEKKFKETIVNMIAEIIDNKDFEKYDAILIDEGQDFYYEWYNLLNKFLSERDELIVVCDKKQNIYERDLNWLDKRIKSQNLDKFGDWIDLATSFRIPPKINHIANKFTEYFNIESDLKTVSSQELALFDNYKYLKVQSIDFVQEIGNEVENLKKAGVHLSDICILVFEHKEGLELVKYFKNKKNIEMNHVFEEEEKKTRHKKSFWMGDSRLKASTIHSFKGWEVNYIILYISEKIRSDIKKNNLLIYTSITRSKQNLVILNSNVEYDAFFRTVE